MNPPLPGLVGLEGVYFLSFHCLVKDDTILQRFKDTGAIGVFKPVYVVSGGE